MQKINQLYKQFQESNQQVIDLEAENYTLNTNLEKLEREFKRLS
jgi:regulator of replication initiation timing